MNIELRDAVKKLSDYCDKNLYTIIKLEIDFINMKFQATIVNLHNEAFILFYNGKDWGIN